MIMRVLHVNDIAFVPSELIKGLEKRGIKSDLLDYKVRKKYKNLKPICCNKFLSLIKYPIDLNKYDIVHLHYPVNILGIATLLHCKKKLVVHLHGTEARRSENNIFYKMILNWAGKKAKIFLYSTRNLAAISKKYNKHSFHLYNPINTSFFKPLKTKQKKRVLIISALHKWKKIEIALDAAKKLKDIQFDVLYYGPKKDKEYYRQWESDNIHFIGPYNYDELAKLFSSYPLLIGQFSGEIGVMELQAMSCAKPIIMYSNIRIPVLNARNSEEVVKIIKKNLKNRSLGRKARKWVIKNHDSKFIIDKLIGFYNKI